MKRTANPAVAFLFFGFCALIALVPAAGAREPLAVVASIQPVHSLVAAVMEGAGRPSLLIQDATSPHRYALRPSQARALERAEVVFWIGEPLETFLAAALDSLAADARVVTLLEADGLVLYAPRSGGEERKEEEPSLHGRESGEVGSAPDPHIWLDPRNARAIVWAAAASLADADPGRAPLYARNGRQTVERIDALEAELGEFLRPVRRRGFILFHDSLQYFERRFDLNHVASLVVHPDRPPSVRRMAGVRARLREAGARCVFGEPQFESSLVETVAHGTDARIGIVDPLGAGEEPGADAYFRLMRNLASAVERCLRNEG